MLLNVLKAHGSQNTFFVIDIRNQSFFTSVVMQQLSIVLCNPNGVLKGADGVLFIDKGVSAAYQMRIFNADGSEALMCGNGMRIVARWALENSRKDMQTIENVTHLPYNVATDNNFHDVVKGVSVVFPPADLSSHKILNIAQQICIDEFIPALDNSLKFTAVAMPNPHIIAIVPDININLLAQLGVQANERKAIFPNGANVSFVKIKDAHNLYVATYERGVGLTNACGTAMIAACVTTVVQKLCPYNEWLCVQNPGGYVKIKLDQNLVATMVGNATYMLEAIIELDEEQIDVYTVQEVTINQKEMNAYDQLLQQVI